MGPGPQEVKDPEELRAQIARTRAELGQDLDVLAEKVTPSRVVERRVDATKEKVAGMKDKIMGSAGSAQHSVRDSAGGGLGAVGDTASSAASLVASASDQARSKTAGNPFAAGIVAFGLGWLVSSLLPASRAEQQGALKVKEAVAEPVKQGLTAAAGELKDNLAPAVSDAAASVKDSATEAAATVKEQAADAAATVKDQASSSAGSVADTAKDQVAEVKDSAQVKDSAEVKDSAGPGGSDEPYPTATQPLYGAREDASPTYGRPGDLR